MPTRRTALKRRRHRRINEAAVKAWKACDYMALQEALGLAPWERSPLPRDVCALGVDEGERPYLDGTMFNLSFDKALALQRELIEAVGMPDREAIRREYLKDLAQEVEQLKYMRQVAADPDWHKDNLTDERRQEMIEEREATIRWRKKLLRELDAGRADA